jgi:predicted dehydrogenase
MLKVGVLGVAHVHTGSYVANFQKREDTELVGYWDSTVEAEGLKRFETPEALLEAVDAVAISGTNIEHEALAVMAAEAQKPILCEKPLATTGKSARNMIDAAKRNGIQLMTAFPCRFSPAYQKLKAHVQSGAIGDVVAICATNRGTCPFLWFVERDKSGGGAMIDHVVHVADLIRDLLGEEPTHVNAHLGNNVYGQSWEDTAMVEMQYPGGVFATLDSSWSRPKTFKTWGDVTMTVTGTKGTIDMDMFGQEILSYSLDKPVRTAGFGSDLDGKMIGEFVDAIRENREPIVTGEHGLAALEVALKAYDSQHAFPHPER